MNKTVTIILTLTMGLIMLALTAIGQDNYRVRSIAEAAQAKDGTWVTVQGNITEKIGDDYFLLVGDTGQIKLKITGDEWRHYSYDPNRKAQVYGKIFRVNFKPMIDVIKVVYLRTKPAKP